MEQVNDNALLSTIESRQRDTYVPPGQFNFVPIEDMFENQATDLNEKLLVDPDMISMVAQHQTEIDKYGIGAMANMGVAVPSLSSDTFDPVEQQNPPQSSYSKIKNAMKSSVDGDQPGMNVASPIFSGIKANNFRRYYEHPKFAELGYRPYSNQEEFYNANSTIWDDMTRMRGQFFNLVGSGFSSVYRSIGDIFEGDAYFTTPDLGTATEFEDVMAIGNSSRDGVLAWTNNLLLNTGYTFGIIGSIAVEELALAGLTAVTGGAAAPVAAARTGYNTVRLGKLGVTVPKFFSKSREFISTLRNVDKAKGFYDTVKSGGKIAADIFTPNTVYAIKNLKTAKNASQNAVALAKMQAGFGGFYRDLRAINLAFAESKLEGGMVYNEVMRAGVDAIADQKGTVSEEDMQRIRQKAAKGAYYTTLANAPLIYFSNKFVLGNALGGFRRSLGQMFNDQFRRALSGRIIKQRATRNAKGELAKNVFGDAGTGFTGWWNRIKAAGALGSAQLAAGATLRYFAANVAEGVQEVSQEAVSGATKGYFKAVIEDPMAGGLELQNQQIVSAIGDQFSGTGFGTFMSGFLMGGIVQVPQKLFFQGVPAIYNYGLNPLGVNVGTQKQKDAFADYAKKKTEMIDALVKTYNNAWNSQVDDPTSIFDPNKFNFLIQKQVAGAMQGNAFAGDRFGFIDQKDFAKFQQLYTVFSTGTQGIFRTQLQDYLKLSDKELAEAFPSSKQDIKSGKIRTRIQDMINNIDTMEQRYEEAKAKFQNPYDRTQFKTGTREFILEALKENAYNHATYLYMFTEDGFNRALERSDSIFQNLANDPLFEKMAASDITVLLSIDSIDNELSMLADEIAVQPKGKDATAKSKKIVKEKKEKLKRLEAIKAVLTNPKNLTKKGTFDRRKIEKLRKEFRNYVRFMASSSGSFIDPAKIDNALKEMVDYYALQGRAKVYDKAIEYLNNPERFNEIVDRQIAVNREIYKDITKTFEKNIKKYVQNVEANELMNQLAAIGIYADPEQTKNFLISGNVEYLKTFYSEQGIVNPIEDRIKFETILRKLEVYREATKKETADSTVTENTKVEQAAAEETKSAQDKILEESDVDVVLEKTNNTPMLNDLLNRRYKRYSATQTVLGEQVLTFDQWRNTQEGTNLQNTFNALKKIWGKGYYVKGQDGNPVFVKVTDKDLNQEKGFTDYLNSRSARESDVVAQILQSADLTLADILGQPAKPVQEGNIVAGDKNKIVFKKGALATILKITTIDPETGSAIALYKIVDNNGGNLPQNLLDIAGSSTGAFDTSTKALTALRKIERTAPNTAEFPFDGVDGLHQGMLVYDKKGVEYVILSTPSQIQGGILRIIEQSKNRGSKKQKEKDVIKLEVGQFKDVYSTQELKFETLNKNVTRVDVMAPVTPYPHRNRGVKGPAESSEQSIARYKAIVSILTPLELEQLEFVVMFEPQSGDVGESLVMPGKAANPYIKRKKSKYKIGLRLSNKNTITKVNTELRKLGIEPSTDPDGIFAYLINDSFQFENPQGNIIDPTNMTREEANNTMFVSEKLKRELGKGDLLNLVHKNFAISELLISFVDTLNITAKNPKQVFFKNDLPFDLSIQADGIKMKYDNSSTRKLTDLVYKAADTDGNFLIYDLKATVEGAPRTEQTITNLEGAEATKLIESVEKSFKEQGIWNQMLNGTDRYVAAVLLPNGKYAPVNLKPREYTEEEFGTFATELIERAQLTQKENLDGSKVKDTAYNIDYNKDILNRLYISSIPGYTVQLQVNPFGTLQMQLFDRGTNKQVGETIKLSKDKIKDNELSVQDKIATLIDLFNDDADIKASGVKVSKNNFRVSFPDTVSATELISKTTTNVTAGVVEAGKLRLSADSASIQADNNTSKIPAESSTPVEQPTQDVGNIAEEAEESILDISQEEFNEYAANDFADLPIDFMNHIVNKKIRGIELNEREKQVEKIKLSEITMAVAKRSSNVSKPAQSNVEIVTYKGTKYSVDFNIGGGTITNLKTGKVLQAGIASAVGKAVVDLAIAQQESKEDIAGDKLSDVTRELDALKTKILQDVPGRSRNKVLRENEEYQKLLAEKKRLEKEANKILPASLSDQDVTDINEFTLWAEDNLPDYITVEDINTLGNNLKSGGVRVGAFVFGLNNIAGNVEVSGTIYTGAKNPFKYHEAFHGVFRLLLTDQEIALYRGIARKEVRAKLRAEGKSFEKELQRFRNSADTYANMTRQELENEYYEEYMADEFEKFKTDPKSTKTDTSVKSLFTRILDWIKSVFNSYDQNELQLLFEKIDSGKFKGASLAANEFTNPLVLGTSVEANALVPYASEKEGSAVGYLYLDNDIADPMLHTIAAMYLNRVSKIVGVYNPMRVMNDIMDDFAWLYDPDNPKNSNKTKNQKQKLSEIQLAFDNYSSEIRGQVVNLLNIIDGQVQEEEYTNEEFEDENGLRTTSQFGKDASLIGGFRSLPRKLRKYIATTTISSTDYFGNEELVDGERLIIPVNFVDAYNGLLKAVKNLEDPKEILQSMYFFGQDNPQAGAVVSRILEDVGLSQEELLSGASLPSKLKDPVLLNSIIKGFENFRVDYIFNEVDSQGNIRIYSASSRDDVNSQVDRWAQAFVTKRKLLVGNETRKKKVKNILQALARDLQGTKNITNTQLQDSAKRYSMEIFDLIGIKLSPLYLQYSMLQSKNPTTVKQKGLKKLYEGSVALAVEDIKIMDVMLQQDVDIFDPGELGMSSKIKSMGINNAPFDETIGASTFKNTEGNLVYAHQLPTYHLKKVESLNKPGELDKIKNSDPYMEQNFLLNSGAFNKMSEENSIRVTRVAGSKTGDNLVTEDDLNESIQGNIISKDYGGFTPQDFALTLINNYTERFNTRSNKVDRVDSIDKNGNPQTNALAPVLIRVLEASNTGDLISLPVIKAVEMKDGEAVLTEELVDIYVNNLRTEFARINRESNDKTRTGEDILGYNGENGRAYTFFNNGLLLSPELRTKLESTAVEAGKQGNTLTLDAAIRALGGMTALRADVVENLEKEFDSFQELIDTLNIRNKISKNVREGLVKAAGVQRKEIIKSNQLLNLNFDETHNLKQIFFNSWVNTGSINEILLGDQSVSLTSPVDQVKRGKMQNAAYYSAYTPLSAPELGVLHSTEDINLVTLEEPVEGGIDSADAQMYITTKAFRHFFFGFGKLSPSQAKLIDDVEKGVPIDPDRLFGTTENPEGLAQMQGMLNSKKLVYADGSTYLKMSAFVLTPEYTSIWNEELGKWVPKPNRKRLHNLRVKLEAIEKDNSTVSIAAPLSASKMKKQRINSLQELDNELEFTAGHTKLNARYMGLQMVNLSNKLDIVDPSQIKELVTSEHDDKVFVEGLDMTVGEIRKEYDKAVTKRVLIKYKNKRNLVFSLETALDEFNVSRKKGAITPKLSAFLSYALNGLKAGQTSSNLLEFFTTTNGVQNYNLNNPITIKKFESLFISYFSRGVLAERAPGLGLTLVSDFGNQVYRRVYEVETKQQQDGSFITVPVRSEIIRESVWRKTGNENDIVQLDSLTNENIPEEGIVVLDRLRTGLMDYTDPKDPSSATGQRYSEMMMPAHHKSVMDLVENSGAKIPDVLSKMFGVRIPSQDNHSTVNVKWVDFMPGYYGSSAMFPRELIEISGADFDIDKVYMTIKDFYVEKGQFIEYGKQESADGRYSDYIRYVNDYVNKPGSQYSEALGVYNNREAASKIENTVDDTEQNIATDAGFSEDSIKALQLLGLPITKKQYLEYVAKHGEPYEAPLNNEILDYRYALMGHRGNTESKDGKTPISYQPANLDPIQDALKEIAEDSNVFKDRLQEDNVDVDNMNGMIKAFQANKGASIGSIVSPNLYLSSLTEYGIKLKKNIIKLNGKFYSDFGVTTINNVKGGERKQNVISALITMATDNAKERLFGKSGFNFHSLGVVANLTGLGIPLKTSLLLINNPTVQRLYAEALNKETKTDPGIEILVKRELGVVAKRITGSESLESQSKIPLLNISDSVLIDLIDGQEENQNFNRLEVISQLSRDVNSETAEDLLEYSVLMTFLKAVNIAKFTRNMGEVTGLTKGLARDAASLRDRYDKIQRLITNTSMMDVRPIYTGTRHKTNMAILSQFLNSLMPVTMLTSSEGFDEVLQSVLQNMDTSQREFNQEVIEEISNDILSYLTIKAYQKNLQDNDQQKAATLSNNILYPTDYESINDIVDRLKTTDVGKDNFFLDSFAISLRSNSVSNGSGLNILEANTYNTLSANQKINLQTDFAKLFGSVKTKNDAIAIINYIMVKDGLQIGYASLLEAVSPFVLNKYLSQINNVESALRNEISFEKVFGMTKEDLMTELNEGYLLSNRTGPKLFTFNRSETGFRKGVAKVKGKDQLVVAWTKMGARFETFIKDNVPLYVRTSEDPTGIGSTVFTTYKLVGERKGRPGVYLYDKVEPTGSNQQNPIGFMFGDRMTYKEVRNYVKTKNQSDRETDAAVGNIAIPGDRGVDASAIAAEIAQEEALKNESANIDADEKSINVQVDPEVEAVNIANSEALASIQANNQEAEDRAEEEANVIQDTDQALPEVSEQEGVQMELFQEEIDDQYPEITNFWDANIQGNKEAMGLLRAQKIVSLEDFIGKYSEGTYENQEQFLDFINRCILKK